MASNLTVEMNSPIFGKLRKTKCLKFFCSSRQLKQTIIKSQFHLFFSKFFEGLNEVD